MEEKMDHDMETGLVQFFIGIARNRGLESSVQGVSACLSFQGVLRLWVLRNLNTLQSLLSR